MSKSTATAVVKKGSTFEWIYKLSLSSIQITLSLLTHIRRAKANNGDSVSLFLCLSFVFINACGGCGLFAVVSISLRFSLLLLCCCPPFCLSKLKLCSLLLNEAHFCICMCLFVISMWVCMWAESVCAFLYTNLRMYIYIYVNCWPFAGTVT